MKKFYFIAFLSLFSFYTNAQIAKNWVEVGIKGDVNFNYLLNTNIIDDVNMNSSYFSVGNFKGVKFGFNFNQSVGVTIDILHSAMNQKYKTEYLDTMSMNIEKKIHLNYVDIPVLFRTFTDVTYFEIGPQISFLVNAKETYSSQSPLVLDYTNTDKSRFSPYNISAVIGFGTLMWGKNNFSLILAFRAAYGFLDIIADKQNYSYPNNGGVGTSTNYLTHQPFPTYTTKTDVGGYKPTTGVTGGFSLELNYNFLPFH